MFCFYYFTNVKLVFFDREKRKRECLICHGLITASNSTAKHPPTGNRVMDKIPTPTHISNKPDGIFNPSKVMATIQNPIGMGCQTTCLALENMEIPQPISPINQNPGAVPTVVQNLQRLSPVQRNLNAGRMVAHHNLRQQNPSAVRMAAHHNLKQQNLHAAPIVVLNLQPISLKHRNPGMVTTALLEISSNS
jgi:hypothetical protein